MVLYSDCPSNICFSRWEHERLTMQKEDLEEKWREIQQTKLSKENQRSLGESSQSSASQEFSALDKARRISSASPECFNIFMTFRQINKERYFIPEEWKNSTALSSHSRIWLKQNWEKKINTKKWEMWRAELCSSLPLHPVPRPKPAGQMWRLSGRSFTIFYKTVQSWQKAQQCLIEEEHE